MFDQNIYKYIRSYSCTGKELEIFLYVRCCWIHVNKCHLNFE